MIDLARRYSMDPLAALVTGTAAEVDAVQDNPALKMTDARLEALAKWSKDPWSFLTGKDPDTKQPIIRTIDQRDKRNPLKPFPAHLDYIHFLIDLLESEPDIVVSNDAHVWQIEKASQMICSTTILLLMLWRCSFKPQYKALLSKHKEDEAALLLDEKIRQVWLLMPEWLRIALPLTLKPKNKITWAKTGATILGLPENAASADARGQTYHTGLIDEAEFQDVLADIITAMRPRAGQIIFWSTPSSEGGNGVATFRNYLADDPVTIQLHPKLHAVRKKWSARVKGMTVRRNEDKNTTIIRIEHSADPSKRWTPMEEDRIARSYPSIADFRREMKIDRTTNAGKPYYAPFTEKPALYIRRAPGLLDAPILRGWDFGRSPACVWGQWSKKARRFWVLREIQGWDIDTYQFRDLVKYLSGQLSAETLSVHKRAVEHLEMLAGDKAYPPPPWFSGTLSFADFAGHEAVRSDPGLVRAGDARIAKEILAEGDIYLMEQYTFERNRRSILAGLSRVREDGTPGIYLDPACPMLIKGLCGGIVYKKATEANPEPQDPVENQYSHLHEALGYILTNNVALEHADYFATTAEGLPVADLTPEEAEVMNSYLTEGWR